MRILARRWKLVLAVALLVGSVAAFAYAERLKLTRAPVGVPRFDRWLSPDCDCPHEQVTLDFLLRKRDRIDVDVVDEGGESVRVLATRERHPAGRVVYEWDGRDDDGAVVGDGPYRVRVRLRDEERTIVIPMEVNVDTRAPRVFAVRAPATAAAGQEIEIRFGTNEFGVPLLVADGEVVLRGPAGLPRNPRTLAWTPPGPGTYRIAISMRDRAGNRSEPAGDVTVVVGG
jgi:hypothetical protein